VAIRDKIRVNAAPLLQPGEEIQAVILAQTVSQYFVLISIWIIVASNAMRVIVVTDRRILPCRSGRIRQAPVGEVLAELPRQTLIGPAHGLWYRTNALGQRLYINRRFHGDVAAADDVATASAQHSGVDAPAADPVSDPDGRRIDVAELPE
jgi:hypothetical protein